MYSFILTIILIPTCRLLLDIIAVIITLFGDFKFN